MSVYNPATDAAEFEIKPVQEMTDREIAEETLMLLRTGYAALAKLQTSGMGRMFAQMMPGINGSK